MTSMFEVQHDHHGKNFTRYFSPGRSSMTAIEDKKAEEFRKHVWAMTMIDEDPLAGKPERHSTGSAYPTGPNKLRSKRRASTQGASWNENDENKLNDLKNKSSPNLTLKSKTTTTTATTSTLTMTAMKGPTVSVQPIHPTSFTPVMEKYPIKEDSIDAFLGKPRVSNAKPALSSNSHATYSVYPAPNALSHVHHRKTAESMPELRPQRPRNLSNTSSISASSMYSSLEGTQSPSWSNRTSIESARPPSSQWRPEYMYQRPMPLKKKKQSRPNEVFGKLPGEVLSLVLENLKDLHLDSKSFSCATCWMRDACNISLSSRKWYKVARIALYEDIQLVGPDSTPHKKKYKLSQGVRVMMLRRTLRANPQLAAIVRSVKVPAPETPSKGSAPKAADLEEYDNLVASIVMACPNLERLNGLNSVYDHAFKRIFHALSSRTLLKEMNWLVQVSPHQQRPSSSTQQLGLMMPGELLPFQERMFLDHHHRWLHLETLTIHCLPGATLTPENLLTDTLSYLPSLKHLHLCNVPPNGFNDTNLLSLPPLRTLTLSHISGITTAGLSSFATTSNSLSLRKLQLRHTPLTSLPALARMFSNLRSLTNFSLVQAFSPVMPEDDVFTLWMMPYLASSSLQKLHWDITGRSSSSARADDILAKSMAAGGFPELRSLRILQDPEGVFQNICYPVARIDLPADRFRNSESTENIKAVTSSPPRNIFKSSSQSSLPSSRPSSSPSSNPPPYTNLQAARLAAQSRLENAHHKPRFTVNVIDEDGTITDTFYLAGFIGTLGSKIKYHLLPDPGSSDKLGGLLDVRDIGGDGGESLAGGKEGCTGRWNLDADAVADRREKERWWHTERGRWRRLEL